MWIFISKELPIETLQHMYNILQLNIQFILVFWYRERHNSQSRCERILPWAVNFAIICDICAWSRVFVKSSRVFYIIPTVYRLLSWQGRVREFRHIRICNCNLISPFLRYLGYSCMLPTINASIYIYMYASAFIKTNSQKGNLCNTAIRK